MITTITMTESQNWAGERYLAFKQVGKTKLAGEVDYRENKFHVFYGLNLIAIYADKDRAITHLQKAVRAGIQGQVRFIWTDTLSLA